MHRSNHRVWSQLGDDDFICNNDHKALKGITKWRSYDLYVSWADIFGMKQHLRVQRLVREKTI